MTLDDEQWAVLETIIPKPVRRPDGKGRPHCCRRRVFEGILWILHTGAQWKQLPRVRGDDPSYQTCHRWFQKWSDDGVFDAAMKALVDILRRRGEIELAEAFIDGSFSSAKKGATESARPSGARVPRSWRSSTATAFPSP